MAFLWLNSDDNPRIWIEKLNSMRSKGTFLIDDDIQTRTAISNDCLGLIIRKDEIKNNVTATLTSWDCGRKKPSICYIEPSRFTAPQKPVKFPCIPQSKFCIMSFGFKTSVKLTLIRFY